MSTFKHRGMKDQIMGKTDVFLCLVILGWCSRYRGSMYEHDVQFFHEWCFGCFAHGVSATYSNPGSFSLCILCYVDPKTAKRGRACFVEQCLEPIIHMEMDSRYHLALAIELMTVDGKKPSASVCEARVPVVEILQYRDVVEMPEYPYVLWRQCLLTEQFNWWYLQKLLWRSRQFTTTVVVFDCEVVSWRGWAG